MIELSLVRPKSALNDYHIGALLNEKRLTQRTIPHAEFIVSLLLTKQEITLLLANMKEDCQFLIAKEDEGLSLNLFKCDSSFIAWQNHCLVSLKKNILQINKPAFEKAWGQFRKFNRTNPAWKAMNTFTANDIPHLIISFTRQDFERCLQYNEVDWM